MTNFKKQLFSVMTAGVLVVNSAGAAFAGTTIQISGNGAGSDNWANVTQNSNTTVNQTNTANVTNNVDSDANTGNNDANFNTGGLVVVDTGNATTNVTVNNDLNSNAAQVDCCEAGNTDVLIEGNGAYSNNGVELDQRTNTRLNQDNRAYVDNYVDSKANTGDNDANLNTGADVVVLTGDASTNVTVNTEANRNAAVIGSGNGASVTPTASFRILGNGAGSDNYINADLRNNTALDQYNYAAIENRVDADADTGDNEAKFNTGGDVIIDTGKATANVGVDNAVNFNYAALDCGCVYNVLAKIDGNGAELPNWFDKYEGQEEGDNIIDLNLASTRAVGQDNRAYLDNIVKYVDAETGNNDASLNTSETDGDPAIFTGDAATNTNVSNSGNVNTLGESLPFEWPFEHDVEFDFNLSMFWAMFGLSM